MKTKILGRLTFNANSNSYFVDKYELDDGEYLDVLIVDGLTKSSTKWIDTHIECDSDNEWYLKGLWGYKLDGLFVEISR